jgi:5-methylthioadenosine/S-adenosylhomocysteine deaminase
MSKTLIKGGYVVSHDGEQHRILRPGVVVFEGSEILCVGRSYSDQVDRVIDASDKLVSPGFINMHALASTSITHLRLDGEMSALNASRAYVVDGEGELDLVGEDLEVASRFALVELLKGGATTSVTITPMAPSRWSSPPSQAEVLARTAGELGARAYVSHQYRSAAKYWDSNGVCHYEWNEEAGRAGLARAVDFAEAFEGSYDDRVRTMLFPYQFDTCSPALLECTREAARERGLIIHMHAAQSLSEFRESLRRYGRSPMQYLDEMGFLGSDVILTHVLYTTFNPLSGFPKGDRSDIERLARAGVTVAHCPVLYSRGVRGEGMLRSFGEYMRMGCNMVLGTDTFPMDMIVEMRCAATMGKLAELDPLAVTARDVFNAATVGGAKALARDDLGRLSPGARADIVIVDLTGVHVGLVDDPIKTLVYMASQQDIETVIVDGKVVVEDGRVRGVDEAELARRANDVNQKQKMAFARQNPQGRSAEDLFPPSFTIEY